MKNDKMISIIYIVIGIGIILLWSMLIGTSQVPEFETEPVAIVFHIVIESTMGIFAILSGIWVLKKYKYSQHLVLFTNGMLMYSVVNSSGYYGDLKQYGMIAMFAFILGFIIYSSWYISVSRIK